MKAIILLITLGVVSPALFAQHALEKLWQTDSVLRAPESVRPDGDILYVSNIGDFDKDGTGFISKMTRDGKMIKRDWVTGLSAPKGLGRFGNLLYAAEQTAVVEIDVNTGAIVRRVPVQGAKMLNDITIDSKGIVYVSDTRTNKVHRIENGVVSLYLDHMTNANGLLAVGDNLYVLTGTSMQKADAGKHLLTLVEDLQGGADGLEMIGPHEFLATGWEGTIYVVKDDGSKQLLLDTRAQGINAADLGYDPSTRTLYVPAMKKGYLVAYRLK